MASEPTTSPETPSLPDDAMIIVPVRNTVLFPGIVLPISVGRQRSVQAAQEAIRTERQIGIVLQRNAEQEEPAPAELYRFGTAANILRYLTAPDGSHHMVCQGGQRVRIVEFLSGYPFLVARVERLEEPAADNKDIEAHLQLLKERALALLELLPQTPAELVNAVQGITGSSSLADLVASFIDIKPEERQEILETLDIRRRIDKLLQLLSYRVEILQLQQRISDQTKEQMSKQQREYYLREQLRTIQKELGEGDSKSAELAELEAHLEAA